MSITIVPNSLGLANRSESGFRLCCNKVIFTFIYHITPAHIVFKSTAVPIKQPLSIVFGGSCIKPIMVYEFIHNPSRFSCQVVDKNILITFLTPFTPLIEPAAVVRSRIDRELTKTNSLITRDTIRTLVLKNYLAKEKPADGDDLEVIPLLDKLNESGIKKVFVKLRRYDACIAFIKRLIYQGNRFDILIESHFKNYASVENVCKTEYTTTCFEYFILRGISVPWDIETPHYKDDLDHYFALKFLDYLLKSQNAEEVVKAKYSYTTDISSYPAWLQAHFLKEYLAAPGVIEREKESCLFHLLSIYIDLKIDQCENFEDLKKLIIVRSHLPVRERYSSDESLLLSKWILETIQNLHNYDYWSLSLRQKVVEISEMLNLNWQFHDTYREAYYPALYYQARDEALPYHSIVEYMLGEILFYPQSEIYHYPLNASYYDEIVPLKVALDSFLNSTSLYLVIEGPLGSGKTLSLFNLAEKLLIAYSDNESYIPFMHFNKQLDHPECLDPAADEIFLKVPFLFIFDDVNSLHDIPYLKYWRTKYPKAKFIFASRNKLHFDEKFQTCTLLPLRQDEVQPFYEKMNKYSSTRFTRNCYSNAAERLTALTPLQICLLSKLPASFLKSDHLNETMHSLEIEWDKSKSQLNEETNVPPALLPIIKWYRKLNQSKSEQ